jgi:hypothetical protein
LLVLMLRMLMLIDEVFTAIKLLLVLIPLELVLMPFLADVETV